MTVAVDDRAHQVAASGPDAEAMRLLGRAYLSWSQFQSYLNCPKTFAFKYVDRLEPEFLPVSMVFGQAFHEAVRLHLESQLTGSMPPTLDDHAAVIGDVLRRCEQPLRLADGETIEDLALEGRRLIEALLTSKDAQPEGQIVGIEEEVSGYIDPDLPKIVGRADLVTLTSNGIAITDYKTAKAGWSAAKPEEHAGQLRLYGALLASRIDRQSRVSTLRFVVVTRTKTCKVSSHEVLTGPFQFQKLREQFRMFWKGVTAGVFPAHPGWACSSCPYQGRCPHAAI